MRVIIAGGGTGGHLFPGIAVAERLKEKGVRDILFIGTERGIEARVIPREGYRLEFIRSSGIVGKSLVRTFQGLINIILSIIDSFRILRFYRPDVVIGVGGYASFGPVVVSRFMGIPSIILEQNSIPGLANKVLSRFASAVCITYHESFNFFPSSKTILTGNPVRLRIMEGSREGGLRLFGLSSQKNTVLIFGGSSGARSINRAVVDSLPYLVDLKDAVQFLHQTGDIDYEFVKEAYRKYGMSGTVAPFIYQMPEAYAVADLIISRSGATTLAEITALGKAAILIPYPFAAGRHQEFNARKLHDMGAAIMLTEKELNGERLAKEIKRLLKDEALKRDLEKNSRAFGRPDAAGAVVSLIEAVVNKKRGKTGDDSMWNRKV
ncbi:MAG: undecaprenyldiphospho-muramoylpentapeptide beta-N-acetylglucosaminyltransferase [Thermodesulfovibrionales bacterium]|nr:undecaprenyldiphospho-muramoylpentapeptide beta-N-acetylglucosaminyltransferase [Thermodesulfovibrionales bacterium]